MFWSCFTSFATNLNRRDGHSTTHDPPKSGRLRQFVHMMRSYLLHLMFDLTVLPSHVHPSYPYGDPTNIKHPAARPRVPYDPASRALFEDMGYAGGGANGTLRWKDLALDILLPVDYEKEEAEKAAQARKMASGTASNHHQTAQQVPGDTAMEEEDVDDENDENENDENNDDDEEDEMDGDDAGDEEGGQSEDRSFEQATFIQ